MEFYGMDVNCAYNLAVQALLCVERVLKYYTAQLPAQISPSLGPG